MARNCSICGHDQRDVIDKLLVSGSLSIRRIAARFIVSATSLRRHKEKHIPAGLAIAQQVTDVTRAVNLREELQECVTRVRKLSDACDVWLRDPEQPDRYSVDPRAEDISVIYSELNAEGKRVRHKAKLSTLLSKVSDRAETPPMFEMVESKSADPRELILKAAGRLEGQLTILVKLLEIYTLDARMAALEGLIYDGTT